MSYLKKGPLGATTLGYFLVLILSLLYAPRTTFFLVAFKCKAASHDYLYVIYFFFFFKTNTFLNYLKIKRVLNSWQTYFLTSAMIRYGCMEWKCQRFHVFKYGLDSPIPQLAHHEKRDPLRLVRDHLKCNIQFNNPTKWSNKACVKNSCTQLHPSNVKCEKSPHALNCWQGMIQGINGEGASRISI